MHLLSQNAQLLLQKPFPLQKQRFSAPPFNLASTFWTVLSTSSSTINRIIDNNANTFSTTEYLLRHTLFIIHPSIVRLARETTVSPLDLPKGLSIPISWSDSSSTPGLGNTTPASSQLSCSLNLKMVASLGNGTFGGVGGQSWEALPAAHSMNTNNLSNFSSSFGALGADQRSATGAITSTTGQLAATDGPHRDHSANFPDTLYYHQPNAITEWTRGQQSASSMDNPLALANTACADFSVNHHDFSAQPQSNFIPEWRRTQQTADPQYNQVELFARYIEAWGLAVSSDVGPSDIYPLVHDSVNVKVPVDFLRSVVNREVEVRGIHILSIGFVWKHLDGRYVIVRLGQNNWHEILNNVRADNFRYFAGMWQKYITRAPAEGPEFSEVCWVCMKQYAEYPADLAVLESSWSLRHFLDNQIAFNGHRGMELVAD